MCQSELEVVIWAVTQRRLPRMKIFFHPHQSPEAKVSVTTSGNTVMFLMACLPETPPDQPQSCDYGRNSDLQTRRMALYGTD